MEQNHETKIYFAIRKETNQLVHISEMVEKDRGMACECVCANCGRPLVAKLGHGGKIRHFAHLADKSALECSADKANESALHKMAKELICKSTYICLPGLTIAEQNDPDRNMDDDEQQKPLCGKKTKLQYQSTQMEVLFDGFKPDICIERKNRNPLLIEIAVTHYSDAEKQEKIKKAEMPAVEINIADFLKQYKADDNESKDEFIEKLKEALIESTENKMWIYHPREKDAIQQLRERNRKLEIKYQQNQIRNRKALQAQKRWEREKEDWVQEQEKIRKQIDIKVKRLCTNGKYYLWYRNSLRYPDDIVLKRINSLKNCKLQFKNINDVPFFLNVPVFGEVVFNCDRRIWQAILFDKVFYQWNSGTVRIPQIYCFFAGARQNLLNREFVYIWAKNGKVKFKENDLLCRAIGEYLVYLSALGFMDIRYYYYPCNDIDYNVIHNLSRPQRMEYAKFLQEVLKNFPDTNDPFGYIEGKWRQTGKIFEKVSNIDTLLQNE